MALPPYCKICNKDIRAEGEHVWITFKETKDTQAIELKNEREVGWTGPNYTDRGSYFCNRHKSIEKYSHLTMQEALKKYNSGIINTFLNIFRR